MKTTTSSTLANFIDTLAFDKPNQVISTFMDEINVYTIDELNKRANLLAKGLLYIGVNKGTPVALVLAGTTNCLTFVIALAKIGAILTPINKDTNILVIEQLLTNQHIHTIGFYADTFLQKFQNIVPNFTQNERGYLKTDKFPQLKNIVTFGSIKNRGIFTTRELMLLGEHMDDIEMEASVKVIKPDDIFINHALINENRIEKMVELTHADILHQNHTFSNLQNLLLNLI